jgi:hypothetical protein
VLATDAAGDLYVANTYDNKEPGRRPRVGPVPHWA